MDEEEAILKLRDGDIHGLEVLVKKYQLKAIRAAYLVTHDRAMAEDIVQSAFIRTCDRIDTFVSSRPFGPWFLRCVVNDAIKALNRQKRFLSLDDVERNRKHISHNSSGYSEPGLTPRLVAAETREVLWEALRKLPPKQRAAIVLRYYLGLSIREIANEVDAPEGTIKWRLYAARKRLKIMLKTIFKLKESKKDTKS
jgi:RNA polymerase sigma-70 factor (ECF subfamily)